MNLHENPDVFEELILATASELRIPTSVVEKDYIQVKSKEINCC